MQKIRWRRGQENGMRLHEQDGVLWFSFPGLDREEGLVNAFSTRIGGASTGDCATMNFSYSLGDKPEHVLENYRRMGKVCGFAPEDCVSSDQTHTVNVRRVTREDCGSGVTGPKRFFDTDGLLTDEPGIVLATSYADCVPLYFYDPVRRAIALSHSGWRGTAAGMGRVTVEAMADMFGTGPGDLLAAIGPSICQDCYEVSRDVAEQFDPACSYETENGKFQLDLTAANLRILMDAGIPKERILLSGLCTCCNPDLLWSHRATKGRRGTLEAFLMLKPESGKKMRGGSL